jgi:hypothetical protein
MPLHRKRNKDLGLLKLIAIVLGRTVAKHQELIYDRIQIA